MPTEYLLMARMDIAHDKESLFNSVYDTDHIPKILEAPGVIKASRYQTKNVAEPRYLGLYQIANPDVPQTEDFRTIADLGRWKPDVRPHTMNRHHAIYTWVGGSKELTYSTSYLYLAMMDVEPHKEALFNEVYETEHIPLITQVSGVANAIRFRTTAEGHPQYMAIYEVEAPDVPSSTRWTNASDTGRWKPDVRPYTYNKHNNVYERIGQ